MSPEFDIANPGTGLFESLRAFGYDLSTAIADLIDNSITAAARNIWIDLLWNGHDSTITIRDDGAGMSEDRLVDAMRPGSTGPMSERSPLDLGRFGLGMKTASISQCRRVTVVSKPLDETPCARCWDLDYLASTGTGQWRLLKGADLLRNDDVEWLTQQGSGTVVLWEKLDRLVGSADSVAERHFRQRAEELKIHLAMVFHRFLTGRGAVGIHLNGRPVEPWDPFMEGAGATQPFPEETLRGLDDLPIQVKPFVLPHYSKLTVEKHGAGAGPRGWNAHQGFYIYRNRRLLVAGDWLGLGVQKEEHYKLARIRVDLPNSADLAWQIDVRKARARPPSELRDDLTRIAKVTRNQAAKIYRHRGKLIPREHPNEEFLWKSLIKNGKTFYKINRDHPLVARVLAGNCDKDSARALVALVEQTVPAPLIVQMTAERPDSLGEPFGDAPSELQLAMRTVFDVLIEAGHDRAEAAKRIVLMEPFDHHPDVLAGFLDSVRS